MSEYKPPFHMTNKIANLLANISEEIGRITVFDSGKVNPKLRRENRIKTIHSSLAIDNNSLTIEQVTAILNGKRILGNPNEIREVTNAYEAYEMILSLDPMSIEDLLTAHKIMMSGLIKKNGKFRSGGEGILKGEPLINIVCLTKFVRTHTINVFDWYKKSDMHPLIKSAIFHYQFVDIHPFKGGNGRLARMWHSMLLGKWKKLFYYLPIEELIRTKQVEYYDVLVKSYKEVESNFFVEFMLEIILDTLMETTVFESVGSNEYLELSENIVKLLIAIGDDALSASEIMIKLGLKHRPTVRNNYIKPALDKDVIEMTIPDKPRSKNQKYRKKSS